MKRRIAFLLAAILLCTCAFPAFAADVTYGDVDGDGSVNSNDALLVLEHKVELVVLDKAQIKLGDVDASGSLDSADALLILEYAVGLVEKFPADVTPVDPEPSVPSTKAEIVEYYNKAANASKAYAGEMKLHIVQGTTVAITDTTLSSALVKTANGMLPNDYPTTLDYTVKNGVATDKTPVKDILPIKGKDAMSELTADDVKDAKIEKTENGFRIEIDILPETYTSISAVPVHHAKCMDILAISEDDLKPFTLQKCNLDYLGGKIVAVVNADGLLDSADIYNPMHIYGEVKILGKNQSANLDGSWKQNIQFTYTK